MMGEPELQLGGVRFHRILEVHRCVVDGFDRLSAYCMELGNGLSRQFLLNPWLRLIPTGRLKVCTIDAMRALLPGGFLLSAQC